MGLYRASRAACLLLLGVAAACAFPKEWQEGLDSWVGRSADSLVRRWGMPTSSYTFEDGSRVLRYAATDVLERKESVYQTYPYGPKGLGYYDTVTTGVTQLSCAADFRGNAQGTIMAATYDGQYGACAKLFTGRF
ncbi:MAG: hypothetical protein U1F33_11305 [Alphaproteobacteria bacterium]